MDKPVKLTGMWSKKSKGGVDYITAIVDRAKLIDALNSVPGFKVNLMLFKNTKRPDHPNDPDYSLSADDVREQQATQAQAPKEDLSLPKGLDEIPF